MLAALFGVDFLLTEVDLTALVDDFADFFELTVAFDFIVGDFAMLALRLYLLDFPVEAVFDFVAVFPFELTTVGVVTALGGLALRTMGGAAAGSSNGKGASSANASPAKTIEPIKTTIFRSTTLPCFKATAPHDLQSAIKCAL